MSEKLSLSYVMGLEGSDLNFVDSQKPYPNEHAARLVDPASLSAKRVRRTHGSGQGRVQGVKIPDTIDIIWFVVERSGEDVPVAQALRFAISSWTEDDAKKWLKDADINYISFEAASEQSSMQMTDEIKSRISSTYYGIKSCNLSVKDVDTTKRIICGYYNSFNYLDSQQDVVLKGAFSKSINENGPNSSGIRKIKHALFHDIERLPGKILVLKENDMGLYFETRMDDSTLGKDTLIKYQEGIYNEHSIGFNYVAGKLKMVQRDLSSEWDDIVDMLVNPKEAEEQERIYLVSEVKLWEGSTVAFGANGLTPVVNIKGMKKEEALIKLNEKFIQLSKALRNGKYSDDCMRDFEIQIRQIQQTVNTLITQEPSIKDTLDDEPKGGVDYEYMVKNIRLFN